MADKALVWLGSSREAVRGFTREGRREAGYQLRRVQAGLMPGDWKPLPTVGAGVYEMRVHVGPEYRVLYVAKFAEAVYVLHAFEKRTRQARDADIALARRRLASVLAERRDG
jgi:putative addiction module killer protein